MVIRWDHPAAVKMLREMAKDWANDEKEIKRWKRALEGCTEDLDLEGYHPSSHPRKTHQ